MLLNSLVIVPFSELGTKSRASREKMMSQLHTNIKHVLKNVFLVQWTKFRKFPERLVYQFREKDVEKALIGLKHIPGIKYIHACIETQTNPGIIRKKLQKLVKTSQYSIKINKESIRPHYFAGEQAKRLIEAIVVEFNSIDINDRDTRRNQKEIQLEVFPNFTYLSLEVHDGMDGCPVGTQNPLISEIIGRPSDLLASILSLKRGIVITPVLFDLGDYTMDAGQYKQFQGFCKRSLETFHGFPVKKFYSVPLDEILSGVFEEHEHFGEYHPCSTCIVIRRFYMSKMIKSLGLAPYIIQGVTECNNDIRSCPFDAIIDPMLNVDNLFFLNPLIFKDFQIPVIFEGYMDSSPVDFKISHAYTWDFCKLKHDEGKGSITSKDIDSIISTLEALDIHPKKL